MCIFFCSLNTMFVPFRWVKREEKEETSAASFDPGPKLDLGFKEGQTIKINIAVSNKQGL